MEAAWVEQYRPANLDDYIFQDELHAKAFKNIVKKGEIPDLLLSGEPGTGKTSIARLLISLIDIDDSDVLIINASDENSIDMIRDKIKAFTETLAFGDYKVILLEEGDYISRNGQAALRNIIEDNTHVKFIITCNYIGKILPAIRSRCQKFVFSGFDVNDVTELSAKILIAEKVNFNINDLDFYVEAGYPDVRSIIMSLQQHTIDSKLYRAKHVTSSADYMQDMLALIKNDKWSQIQTLTTSQVSTNEWPEVYRFLYDNLSHSKKFSAFEVWQDGIVIIAEYLYRHEAMSDAIINASAMFISLDLVKAQQ